MTAGSSLWLRRQMRAAAALGAAQDAGSAEGRPRVSSKEPCLMTGSAEGRPRVSSKEPCLLTSSSRISSKEACLLTGSADGRPRVGSKEPCLLTTRPMLSIPELASGNPKFVQMVPTGASPLPESPQKKARRPRPPAIDCIAAAAVQAATDPFSRADCQQICDRFELFEQLGQGTSAVVYRARPLAGGENVALKVLRIRDEELLRTAREEYELLRSVEHPHIIRAVDFFTFSQGAALVLSYFCGRSLEDAVAETPGRRLEEQAVRRLSAALLDAVAHLHRVGIIHRDVKGANLLVDDSLTDLRLIDFNTAARVLDGALTMTGTADYLPPEVLMGSGHSTASDVWASGLCIHLMLSGSLPLRRCQFLSHEAFGRAAASPTASALSGPQWDSVSDHCKRVVQRCLIPDPEERPAAVELLDSDWLRHEPRPAPAPEA